jgi:LacI family gluconate utilization system Gnt-I transcriptional repressor
MEAAVPTLSSVRTNRYEMGRDAATMVIEAIEGRRPEQPVVDLGFSVVRRQSSARRGRSPHPSPTPLRMPEKTK